MNDLFLQFSLSLWRGALFAFLTVMAIAPTVDAQNLRIVSDMEFGLMDFTSIAGRARLGTNGSITYVGGLSGAGLGTAAAIRIAGRSGTPVDISCSQNGTLSNGLDTFRVRGVEMIVGTTGVGYGQSGSIRCEGLGINIIQLVSGNQNSNRALIGARLATDGTESDGEYDTMSSGGVPPVIEMVVP